MLDGSLSREEAVAEFSRCKADFAYFCRKYLRVSHRDIIGKTVPFHLKPAQERVIERFVRCGVTYVLKARRMGISRAILAWLFWKVHFNAGVVAVTVANDDAVAVEIFKQIREWYDGLPGFFKMGLNSLKANRSDELYYEHLGSYRVTSADSLKVVGGQTIDYRHYTEFAKYKNPEQIIAYIENGSSPNGRAIYETTADGLGYSYGQWVGKNGWEKVFLPWTLDPGYSVSEQWLLTVKGRKPDDVLYDVVREYAAKYGLTYGQALWMGNKLTDMGFNPNDADRYLRLFNQEHPITADVAFSVSTGRVFNVAFGDVQYKRGRIEYHEPASYTPYVMGVDTASGSDSAEADFSAYVVLDVLDKEKPRIVSTFYDKLDTPSFAELVRQEAIRYGCLVNVERNSFGLDILTRLQEEGFGNLYREVKWDKIGKKYTERMGYQTLGGPKSVVSTRQVLINLLIEYINGQKVLCIDKRLQDEINGFSWVEGDRAEAQKPHHDDMLFALALALVARDQVHLVQNDKLAKKPRTWQEIRDYRKATKQEVSEGFFEEDQELLEMLGQPLHNDRVLRPTFEIAKGMRQETMR